MDWFSWLSRTNLQDSLIYEYGLSFSNNELEYEDIAYLNHELLQSMGISIAKHRLEILKLARRDRRPTRSISRVLISIRHTGKRFSEYVRAWIRREESCRALVVVPQRCTSSSGNGRWKGDLLKRNKRSVMPSNGNKEERLLLTNGTIPCKLDNFSNDCDGDTYCGKDVEEIKWESMFQDLKPT